MKILQYESRMDDQKLSYTWRTIEFLKEMVMALVKVIVFFILISPFIALFVFIVLQLDKIF